MSVTIPSVRGGLFPALYPLTRTVTYDTIVNIFRNGSEQRMMQRDCLMELDLSYHRLLLTDSNALQTMHANALGQASNALQITLNGVTYGNLGLTSDIFEMSENAEFRHDVSLNFRQVVPQPITDITTGLTHYPNLSSGILTQLPFAKGQEFASVVGQAPSGPQQTFSYYGGGLGGSFPGANGLKRWTLSYPHILDADVLILENYFHYCRGRWRSFTFTDPDTSVDYTHVRFDMDKLEIKYLDYHKTSITVHLKEFQP